MYMQVLDHNEAAKINLQMDMGIILQKLFLQKKEWSYNIGVH